MYVSMGLPGPFRIGTRIGRSRAERAAARRRRAARKQARVVARHARRGRNDQRMAAQTTRMPVWVWWVWGATTLVLAIYPPTLIFTGFAGLVLAQYAMCRAAGTSNAREAAVTLWARRTAGKAGPASALPGDAAQLARAADAYERDGMPQSAAVYRDLAADAHPATPRPRDDAAYRLGRSLARHGRR